MCAQSFMRPVGLCVRIYPGDLEGLPPVHLASAAGHHGDGWSANPPQEHLRGVIIIVVIVAITISIHLLKTQRKYVFILLSLLPVEGVAYAILLDLFGSLPSLSSEFRLCSSSKIMTKMQPLSIRLHQTWKSRQNSVSSISQPSFQLTKNYPSVQTRIE